MNVGLLVTSQERQVATSQFCKLCGAELKIAKQRFALSGQSLAHIMALPQAVAKTAMVNFLRN